MKSEKTEPASEQWQEFRVVGSEIFDKRGVSLYRFSTRMIAHEICKALNEYILAAMSKQGVAAQPHLRRAHKKDRDRMEAAQPQRRRNQSDTVIRQWADRHDFQGSATDLRAAFEDAASTQQSPAETPTDGVPLEDQLEGLRQFKDAARRPHAQGNSEPLSPDERESINEFYVSHFPKGELEKWNRIIEEAAYNCSATNQQERKRVIAGAITAALAGSLAKVK